MDDHYSQLINYIQQHMQYGTQVPVIRQSLIDAGWDPTMVDLALAQILQSPEAQSQVLDHKNPPDTTGVPKKYKVFQAISDTVTAIRQNAKAFFLSGSAVFVTSCVVTFAVGIVSGSLFSNSLAGKSFAANIITLYIVTLLLSTIVNALIQIIGSVTLYDGSEGRKTHAAQILAACRGKLLRVIGANLLFGLSVAGPLIAISILGLILSFSAIGFGSSHSSSRTLLLIVLIGGLFSSGWMIIAVFRYALAPLVAVFEDIPLSKILARSNHLLAHGGKWFLVKGLLLTLAVMLVLSAITGQSLQETGNTTNPILVVLIILIGILANGGLVMLYRNRRIVRGSQ